MDIVIGAGISGLSYAANSKNKCLIIEKDSEIGGYCKTIIRNGFVWDYSGHFFHFNDDMIRSDIVSRIDCKILEVQKKSSIYHEGKYIDFPFQKNIHQLEYSEFIDCLVDLVNTRDDKRDINSFKDMIISKYGHSICNKFLIPYNEKLYACDLDQLDKDSMGRFFPNANLSEIVNNFRSGNNASYNSTFIYPEGGAIEFVKSMEKKALKNNAKILLNAKIMNIDILNKSVQLENGDVYSYDNLINTAPLTSLFNLAKIEYDKSLYSSNKVAVFNLGFDQPTLNLNHWVYFANKDTSFYRVGFYNNIFSAGNMSLYVELGFEAGVKLVEKELLNKVMLDLRKVGIIENHQLVDYCYIEMDPAYVHINKLCEHDKKDKFEILQQNDVFSIGRYGSWTYCSIEDNIKEAMRLATSIQSN